MISRLTTNYTYFMREGAHYDFLRRVVLPEWTGRIRDRDLRVWSAGCSSGEEAYSIAMTIDEYFGLARDGWDTTVLATDISARVIDEAKRGAYQDARLDGLGEARRASHFTRDADGTWRVTERLRHTVVFARFNLMDSFARFKRPFHIIFCRNVMIYFDAETREALARKFRDALEPGGYLFLGMSETLSGARTGFEPVSPAVYRKAGV
jgi:chemotaxis protein methyltransferase CheR